MESRKTWVSVTFEQGKQGYIDLDRSAIQKLSDADFPRFMGWQKIDEGNTPFSDDVQCDLTELRHFVQYVEDRQTPEQRLRPGFEQEDRLALYIQDNPEVRARLRGFICHVPSEWDASGNDVRYKRLNDPDGFYGKRRESDPDGYRKFIRFLTKFQFLEKTPLGAGRKFWFFHPLAFIRHFRRCGWLSRTELATTFPKHLFYTSTGNPRTAIAKNGVVYTLTRDQAIERISTYVGVLNKCSRKYMGSDSQRMSLFLAQALWETAQWRNLGGMRRIFHEWGFGRFAKENPATEHYSAFYGRGIMQLTWAGNYREYGEYCAIDDHVGPYMERLTPGAPRIKSDSRHYTYHPEDNGQLLQWAPRYDPDIVGENAFHACESGGFYWVSKQFSLGMNMNRVADLPYSAGNVARLNRLVNGGGNGFYERQAYTVFIMDKLCDEIPPENTIIVNRPPRANVLPCTTSAP